MDINDNLKKSSEIKKDLQSKSKDVYYIRSEERLNRSIERKFKTTFIGALSAFEEAFGDEWGHKLPESSLTEEQLEKRNIWEQVRNTVLNNGNNQLRAAQTEISEYTIEWNRYQTKIPVRRG